MTSDPSRTSAPGQRPIGPTGPAASSKDLAMIRERRDIIKASEVREELLSERFFEQLSDTGSIGPDLMVETRRTTQSSSTVTTAVQGYVCEPMS
jgi:hypothetical protein